MPSLDTLDPSGRPFNPMAQRVADQAANVASPATPLTRDQAASAIHKIIGHQVIVNVPHGMTAQITFIPIT